MTAEETPHVFIRGEGGGIIKLDLPLHEAIEDRLKKGYLVRVADMDGNPFVETADAPAIVEVPTVRPEVTADKATWVGWAVAEAARRGDTLTPDDAEALTLTDLIEKYGTDPAPVVAAPVTIESTDFVADPAATVIVPPVEIDPAATPAQVTLTDITPVND